MNTAGYTCTTGMGTTTDVGLLWFVPVSTQAYESAQGTRDAQLKISELDSQLSEVRSKISEKTEECERESNAAKRAQEDATLLRKKVDKYKNREQSSLGDEVLLEEIKMYKVR